MDTLKAERTMNSTEALRERITLILMKYSGWFVSTAEKNISADLTAVISENYVERAKYDEAVRQRDELREALKQLVHLHGCEQEGLLSGQPTPEQWYKAVERAEAAIKSTE